MVLYLSSAPDHQRVRALPAIAEAGVGCNRVRVLVRQVGSQRNHQEQVEALVRLLLEPVGRRQRQKVLALLDA